MQTALDAGNGPPGDSGTGVDAEAEAGVGKDTGADRADDGAMSDAPMATGGLDGGGGTSVTGGTGGTGGGTAGTSSTGGMTGGASSTGVSGSSGGTTTTTGGVTASGGTTTGGGTMSAGGNTGGATTVPVERPSGPCDIYADASTPCVAAYSMVRALSKSYAGPLFQVRAGSSSTNSTMSGGTTQDIMPGPDGFADISVVDAACGKGYCTVSILYDHSGNGNDLRRAPKGMTAGGPTAALDDYESSATKGLVTAGGHEVYSLYMNKLEGYRLPAGVTGKGMPTGAQPQGTYVLADGARNATGCCWEFGNVTSNPATDWRFVDSLFFGKPIGASGSGTGPWFAVDFGSGIWAGGAKDGDPGAPGLDPVPNPGNPSLKVSFALGFLKVSSSRYALRVADLSTTSGLVTVYEGQLPALTVDHQGGIALGVDAANSNSSWGTFYEGAIVAGYPTDAVELAAMKNITAVGYAR